MAHNIETHGSKAAFVSARKPAWHQLGTVLPETFTAEEAMTLGHLGDWNVRKVPLVAALEDGRMLDVPHRYATVRDNPFEQGQVDVLGQVGGHYTPIQNEEHAALLSAVADESGAVFETAGSIGGGRQVFLTMRLPGHMLVGGQDRVDCYLAAMNSHDGSLPFTLLVTPIRVVCQNTLNVALKGAPNTYRRRHRGGTRGIVYEAREALDLTFDYLDAFQLQAERLINETMTQQQFEQIIAKEYGAPEDSSPQRRTRAEDRLDQMLSLFAQANTQAGIRDTAWAGFNALTEWYDHFSPTRAEDEDTRRAEKAVLDPSFKERALAVVSKAVGV